MEVIHIQWEGPLTRQEALRCKDRRRDCGIYQVCGPHPVYGVYTVLYIGLACNQSFGKRLGQGDRYTEDGWQFGNGTVKFYLGRLWGSATPAENVWSAQIGRAERLLIVSHSPAHNKDSVTPPPPGSDKDLYETIVLNWGDRGCLLPEVSGARWSSRFNVIPNYHPYGSHTSHPGDEDDDWNTLDDADDTSEQP